MPPSTLNSLGLLKFSSCSSAGFDPHRGRGQRPLLFSHGQCSWQVPDVVDSVEGSFPGGDGTLNDRKVCHVHSLNTTLLCTNSVSGTVLDPGEAMANQNKHGSCGKMEGNI